MSIPRRGSRPIVVDGRAFRWRVRPDATSAQRRGDSPFTLAVQGDAPGERSVLHLDLAVPRNESVLLPSGTMITPHMVRQMIRAALADGWDPASSEGRAMRLPVIAEAARVAFEAPQPGGSTSRSNVPRSVLVKPSTTTTTD